MLNDQFNHRWFSESIWNSIYIDMSEIGGYFNAINFISIEKYCI